MAVDNMGAALKKMDYGGGTVGIFRVLIVIDSKKGSFDGYMIAIPLILVLR